MTVTDFAARHQRFLKKVYWFRMESKNAKFLILKYRKFKLVDNAGSDAEEHKSEEVESVDRGFVPLVLFKNSCLIE